MEDRQIIELYFARSERAVEAAAKKYAPYCRAIADNILQSPEDTEECLNDTWFAAWNSIPPQRPKVLSVYLGRITRNFALNRLKHYGAQKRGGGQAELVLSELGDCIPDSGGVEEKLDEILLKESLNRFLAAQPPLKRNIFIRRYWAMDPVERIAASCGMGRGRVATMLYRMRRDLKAHLEKEGIAL